jgi:antitoxin ParD1/3/4
MADSPNENTTVTISMPESLREFVRERMGRRGFTNVSEYFRYLVREDERREAEDRLEALLLEGLDSGKRETVTPEWWEKMRAEWARKYGKAKAG